MKLPLNPLELIEKLINEHGSSSILRERLELFRDHIVSLQRKVVDLEQKVVVLEGEKAEFASQVRVLQAEIEKVRIEQRVTQEQNQVLQSRLESRHAELHRDEETILRHLALIGSRTTEEIASAARIGEQTTRLHLDELKARDLVQSFGAYMNTVWSLTDSGRKRMFEMGLLK